MYFDKKGLKELVEKRIKLRKVIEGMKKELDVINKSMQDLQKSHEQTHIDFADVNAKINDLVLQEAIDACTDLQVPGEVIIKDGRPFMIIEDFIDRAKKDAKQAKKTWSEHLAQRAKSKENTK